MDKFLETIFESQVLSEETKSLMRTEFEKYKNQLKETVELKVRGELAEKYGNDRSALLAAMDELVQTTMNEEIKELRDDITRFRKIQESLAAAKTGAQRKERMKAKQALVVLEAINRKLLAKELVEFRGDARKSRVAKARIIKETQARAERDRERFVKRGARVIEHIVQKELKNFVVEMKDDIEIAKRADFGKRIYEQFEAEFYTSHFNSDKTTKALKEAVKKLSNQNKILKKRVVKESQEKSQINEKSQRAITMTKLLEHLSGSAKEKMAVILETTPTTKLEQTFRKFLPTMMEKPALAPPRKRLNETAFHSGFKEKVPENEDQEVDSDILALRRRIGK